ncbi:MAG: diguanylate cyclase [Thermodesulfobacteria bacterium]|nr:diguanylate cyclase [Thermodesulfobacteriota bacterium]
MQQIIPVKLDEKVVLDILENIGYGAYILTPERKIIYWNKAAEKITGFSKEEVLGKSCKDNILKHIDETGKNLCLEGCPVIEVVETGLPVKAKVYLHHKLGCRIPVECYFSPVKNENKVIAVVEVFREVDEECEGLKQRIEMLEELALIDELTELFNRRYINWVLSTKINEVRRFERTFGVIFFDINNFKEINDSFGHIVGDKVLKLIADTLKTNFRMEDIAGRWGGDEFILIVTIERKEDLTTVARKLKVLVENSFIEVKNKLIKPSISIGASIIRKNDTLETLINRVDMLMYKSKSLGGAIVVEE